MTNRAHAPEGDAFGVAVVIAAYNARDTIGRAITSALAEPEVAEVIVVDDLSTDDTFECARAADDGSSRLCVLLSDSNGGPAAARNRAIDASRAPIVALLDADDFFLPGRFASLLAEPDWDFVADNIAIVREDQLAMTNIVAAVAPHIAPMRLTATMFVESCLTRPDRYRGELAFLKPAMRRSFLDAHRLRYAPQLRLAEDFDFYTRALMAGARFAVVPTCNYVAVERATSLSATHSVADLERFTTLDRTLLLSASDADLQVALRQHLAQTHRKFRHRAFLAMKAERGLLAALVAEAAHPGDLARVLSKIASDKLSKLKRATGSLPPPALRYLIER